MFMGCEGFTCRSKCGARKEALSWFTLVVQQRVGEKDARVVVTVEQ